ncbi:MAG TPA: HAMP domain-containing sensor histidine kinase [Candidatus Lustribacter sp.]|nr:HAMP domain-containing sensor histidine kinase [Candidatus Lustribacter sp.]
MRTLSSWPLSRKLVTAMVALFVVVTAMTGVVTVLAVRTSAITQVDEKLLTARQPLTNLRDADRPGGGQGGGGDGPTGLGRGLAYVDLGATTIARVNTGVNTSQNLTADQVSAIITAADGSEPVTVGLGDGLDDYRFVKSTDQRGGTIYVGLPLRDAYETVRNLVRALVLLAGLGVILIAAGGLWAVRATLRPLQRVAATATRVSRLELAEGEVALAERVPVQYTDPRTEVGQVGLALNNLLDTVGSALNARHRSEQRVRQFVADASHELRTPLASIRGYAELSRREKEPVPASVTHALGRVESEATRMSQLVEDLLLLARLDAGRPLVREPVDLTQLTVDAVSDAHAASPEHRWQLDLPDEPVEISGDPARLHQIIANLLANARTHTPAGTTVRAGLATVPEGVRISVWDNGPGVPKALQVNVFERFARGDTSRNRAAGSTGLGLSIVAAVAQAHGGRVELDSQPGHTTFTVTLPAQAAS